MKRWPIIIVLSFGILVGLLALFIIARVFNLFQYYRVPTTNMDPTFRIGNIVYGSCLFNYNKTNIVAYKADPSPFDRDNRPYIAVGRIIGEENDEIQVRNGLVYVNGEMKDDTLHLSYNFTLKYTDINFVFTNYDSENKIMSRSDSMIMVNLSYPELRNYGYNKPLIRTTDTNATWIKAGVFGNSYPGNDWTMDNFGPVTVPTGFLFLMGDNRSNSVDSRIRGFISRDKLVTRIKE